MSAPCRTTVVLLTLALAGNPVRAADDEPAASAADPSGVAVDRRAGRQLEAAADHITDEDWPTAVRALQQLLDGEPDALARVGGRYVSARAEAERLLAALSESGREAYQRDFGPRAAALLAQARKGRDAVQFARVVRRYLYTDAGPDALQALARLHDKAGRTHLAARCYAKLLDHLGPARWTGDDLYQATAAFRRSDLPGEAERTLAQLLARARHDVVRLGERRLTVEDLRKEVERASAPRRTADWPVFGGDARRTARGVGGLPFLTPAWRSQMMYEDRERNHAAHDILGSALTWSREHTQPVIPAFSPIAVMVSRGEKKVPLLIYKNYWGVVARDFKTGVIAWAAPSGWSLERMLRPHTPQRQQQAMRTWLNYYVAPNHQQPQILWENSTFGTLSTDGRFVYSVEDLAVPPPQTINNVNMGFPGGNVNPNAYGPEVQDAIAHSRLQAFSLANSGRLTWELGGEDKGPLADCYFLGPPLPLDGLIYVLIDKQGELRLVCLDPNVPDERHL